MIEKAILLWLICFPKVMPFKSGAPASMCESMEPHHEGAQFSNSKPPYNIDVLPQSSDGLINLRLSGQGTSFRGVLLQARPDLNKAEVIGSFINVPNQLKTLNCGNIADSAVTHFDNQDKNSIELKWEAPDYEGDVRFIATVVHNFTTYWRNVTSDPVKVSKRDISNIIPITMYDGCGTRKNCLGAPKGCVDKKDCIALLTASKKSICEFEMMALKSRYVAIGFSEDAKMGGDHVIECAYENHLVGFEGVKAHRSWNKPFEKANERLDSETGLTLQEGSYKDGNVQCKVTFNCDSRIRDSVFDLTQNKYYLLLAAGSQASATGVGYHDVAKEVSLDSRLLSDLSPILVHDEFYDGCEVEKNCFGFPDNCIGSQQCQIASSVTVQGTKYTFEMKAKDAAYVAIGLSFDNKMGNDSVMECVREGNSVKVYMSWNEPGVKANTRKNVNQNGIQVIKNSYDDGVIKCKFTRDLKTKVVNQTFDLVNDQFFLLLASGNSLKESSVGFHDIVFTSSQEKRSLSNIGAFSSNSRLFIRLHGCFMIAAWIGTASLGIILARYFKQTWVESSLCAKDLWFAWHRFFMLMTWCLTIVAFVLIFVEVEGWVEGNSQIHGLLGCITTALCFIQPFGAALRPHPTARNRPIFNWLHWLIGNLAHICAIVTIFFAIPLPKAQLPDWLDWILVAFVALYVLVHLFLTIGGCISERKTFKRVNNFPMKDMNTSRNALNSVERKEDAPHSGFRKLLLFIHIIGITTITAAIIVIIALAPIEVQWTSLQKKIMSM